VNFHPAGVSDINQYSGNDAGLRANEKHASGAQRPSNTNALHRSQSYKLTVGQRTAGMTQKVNQDIPLDFESLQNVSDHLRAETHQSLMDYTEMAHIMDQSDL
jgi:hypothetical protein